MKYIYIILIFIIIYIILRVINTIHFSNYENNIYKNSTIPIFIISYNQYTFVKSMVEQLQKYSTNIYVIDNKSTYPPLVAYLKSIENQVKVLYMPENYGHRVCERDEIVKLGGDKYIITDPDLLLNPNLPQNFIDILSNISDKYEKGKVGFALDINSSLNLNLNIMSSDNKMNIIDWESRFWINKINDNDYELYNADIDTTFVLINRKYYSPELYSGIRVAGNFTCIHLPWLLNYDSNFLEGELKYYRTNNISTTWVS